MTRRLLALALVGAVGCSGLDGGDDQLVALELVLPVVRDVEVGDTLQLTARGLNRDGEPLPVDIAWFTPDNTVWIDATGRLTGLVPGQAGRVQARSGNLRSELVPFRVLPGADTLVMVGPEISQVPVDVAASEPLVARLDTHSPVPPATGTQPLAGRGIIYRIVEPVFPDPSARTVELLPAAALADTVITDASGGPPAPGITVGRIPGVPSPDSAVVEVVAERLSGRLVPGSGRRFVVRFDNP
ncbi:MAG TPA: hypothetical protein VNK43_00340 [Gemmatimonadales bacterium]|nr:hypothetical protein [Gemmatimonadales bacterium]